MISRTVRYWDQYPHPHDALIRKYAERPAVTGPIPDATASPSILIQTDRTDVDTFGQIDFDNADTRMLFIIDQSGSTFVTSCAQGYPAVVRNRIGPFPGIAVQ